MPTLGDYLKIVELFGEKPAKFIRDKIAEQSEDAKVIAHESQMLYLFAHMAKEEKEV